MSRLEAEVARLLNLFSTACNMDTARKEGCPKCTSIDVCLAILYLHSISVWAFPSRSLTEEKGWCKPQETWSDRLVLLVLVSAETWLGSAETWLGPITKLPTYCSFQQDQILVMRTRVPHQSLKRTRVPHQRLKNGDSGHEDTGAAPKLEEDTGAAPKVEERRFWS